MTVSVELVQHQINVEVTQEAIQLTIEQPNQVQIAFAVEQGPPGGKGDPGIQGPPGMAGANYEHAQTIPSNQWFIDHGLNRYPSVTTIDSAGSVVEGDVEYASGDQIIVSFSYPFAGKAYLN